ncbi:ATP-grasp domain-containing protein [Methanobacterium ferruginis]|uniref:ATP-grasp domain-containing protein n=1 Tax=Methanobacterium ferruginis TaxID=710191 RepID=UPI0025738A9E|nr:ATP-grasp domain-containing protein [Methanobacterium ferruginis]BDZ66707.1 ATP-dependent carboligase [Methanobacterium ferruginis]
MEKILLAGANTRAVACSLKKLGYQIYSADYFGAMDLQNCTHQLKSVLDQKPYKSCGKFTEHFNPLLIREMALEMVDDVEGVICCAGASPDWFPSHKIIGNPTVEGVEDKFRLYQKLKNSFNVPDTYLLTDSDEAREIVTSTPEKQFILKPRYGSGGYGVRRLDSIIQKTDLNYQEIESDHWILQEFIAGENISASVLSTRNDVQTILTSSQIIGDAELGQREPFGYCGNITPYTGHEKISEIAQKVTHHLSLIGSNGVDFIIKDGEIYLLEVNPRLQGTFECAERALNINLAEAHLEACKGHLMEVTPPDKFAVKMIIHAQQRSQVGDLDFAGVHDLPYPGVIIEKGEPLATVITSGKIMEDTIYSAKKIVKKVYKTLKPAI